MGVDRKGPLAAFVVVAVIAAVLLVTSVRSQASPGWLNPGNLPASVLAGPPGADAHLWESVTAGVDQMVEQGAVLVQKVTSDPSEIQDSTVTAAVATSGSVDGSHARAASTTTRHHHVAHVRHHSRVRSSPPATHDRGRHLGWSHARGHASGRSMGNVAGHGHRHGHDRHLGWSRH